MSLFKCCKHGTCPKDCPICQRILLVWTLRQIIPGLLKEMIRYIASFLPRERSLIVCSMCNITRYRLDDWSSFDVEDLDGTLVIDWRDQTVRISCGYRSRYDNDEICFKSAKADDIDGLKKMTYEEFKRRYGTILTFKEVDMYHPADKELYLANYGEDMPISNKEVGIYKEYLINICDNCIDHMIETGMVDHKREYIDEDYWHGLGSQEGFAKLM